MTEIAAEQVKQLRQTSGAGMMDCKRALIEADGDMVRAGEILREKGLASAAKRAGRSANQGLIDSYIHFNNTVGVLIEVNCETDFVANTDDFRSLARNIAMQVAAMNPAVIAPDDRVHHEVEGSDEEVCLLSQPFIRDGSRTIGSLISDTVAKTGENIRVRRFVRFELGR